MSEIPNALEVGRLIERAATTVAPLFEHHGWQWVSLPDGRTVPDKDDIARRLEDMITRLYQNKWGHKRIATGRLAVERDEEDGEWLGVFLELGEVESE